MTTFAEWDGPAFAAELAERIIEPGQHATELMGAWPYLTRMFTRVSAEEMSVDPIFQPNAALPDVALPPTASRECADCEDDAVVTLPDGRMIYVESSGWPQLAGMPWAERIETIPANGAPFVEADHRAEIDAALADYNAGQDCPVGGSASGTDGGDSQETGAGDSQDTGAGEQSDADGSATDDGSAGQDGGGLDNRGCACRSTRSPAALPLLVLFGALLRRRRR
jgi:MYXO-CTERM domain-containing protein